MPAAARACTSVSSKGSAPAPAGAGPPLESALSTRGLTTLRVRSTVLPGPPVKVSSCPGTSSARALKVSTAAPDASAVAVATVPPIPRTVTEIRSPGAKPWARKLTSRPGSTPSGPTTLGPDGPRPCREGRARYR